MLRKKFLTALVFTALVFLAACGDKIEKVHSTPSVDGHPLDAYVASFRKGDFDSLNYGDVPEVVNLEDKQTEVKNQGTRGACGFFAVMALLEGLVKAKQNVDVNFSEEHLIYFTKVLTDEFTDTEGSNAIINAFVLKGVGALLEKDFPYQPTWFGKDFPCENYSQSASTTPARCYSHDSPSDEIFKKVIPMDNFEPDDFSFKNTTQIVQKLSKGQPVVVLLPINTELKEWNSLTGEVDFSKKSYEDCQSNPDHCGGHIVAIVGYDLKKKVFKFKNSWGAEWGNHGYGTIPFDYINHFVDDYLVTATLTEAIPLPEDYQVSPKRELQIQSVVAKKLDDNISVSYTVHTQNMKTIPFFTSVYVMTKVRSSDSEDDNFDFVELPAALQEKYGSFRTMDSRFIFVENEQDDVQVTINFPSEMIDQRLLDDPNTFLRITTYHLSDIDNQNISLNNKARIYFKFAISI